MKTLAKFIEASNIPASLIRGVVRQSGGWSEFPQTARDVCRGGADAGFGGFIYYRDTCAFTTRHKAAILEYAKQIADDIGETSIYSLIGGFNCLKMAPDTVAEAVHNPRSGNRDTVYNALAWFALEEVARAFVDYLERGAD